MIHDLVIFAILSVPFVYIGAVGFIVLHLALLEQSSRNRGPSK